MHDIVSINVKILYLLSFTFLYFCGSFPTFFECVRTEKRTGVRDSVVLLLLGMLVMKPLSESLSVLIFF